MKLTEYRNSSSWLGAIELGPKLMTLAEELPASEELGLSLQLRKIMVELPATIAADLLQGSSEVRLLPVLKLLATLELIDRVYPALDTAGVRADADKLVERLMSPTDFTAGPEAAPAPAAESEPEAPEAEDEPETPADPEAAPVVPTEAPDVAAITGIPGIVVQPDGTVGQTASPTPDPTSVPVSAEPTL